MLREALSVSGKEFDYVLLLTLLRTRVGWLYFAAHKDLFNGEIVGYALDKRMISAHNFVHCAEDIL